MILCGLGFVLYDRKINLSSIGLKSTTPTSLYVFQGSKQCIGLPLKPKPFCLMMSSIKKLPHIDVTDDQGNKKVLTKIPEVLYQYLYGNF